jgi:hypothetical protein
MFFVQKWTFVLKYVGLSGYLAKMAYEIAHLSQLFYKIWAFKSLIRDVQQLNVGLNCTKEFRLQTQSFSSNSFFSQFSFLLTYKRPDFL